MVQCLFPTKKILRPFRFSTQLSLGARDGRQHNYPVLTAEQVHRIDHNLKQKTRATGQLTKQNLLISNPLKSLNLLRIAINPSNLHLQCINGTDQVHLSEKLLHSTTSRAWIVYHYAVVIT